MSLSRRELIAALLGVNLATYAGCSRSPLPAEGELFRTHFEVGHRIRDGASLPVAENVESAKVVIVGGGVAGLSVAWRFLRMGVSDFVLLELESQPGGTAKGGEWDGFRFPWGAHYLPVPMKENAALIDLLDEIGVVEGRNREGEPIISESVLCRDPQERLFHNGRWQEGLFPADDLSQDDARELREFTQEIDRWVERRDPQGRRIFAIPMATGSDGALARALDRDSMATWLERKGWRSERLRWLIDYACRDDYGLSIEKTSAWAGLFYFASRMPRAGAPTQEIMTWPEGNARIVHHLAECAKLQVRTGKAVFNVVPDSSGKSVTVSGCDAKTDSPFSIRSQHVVIAAPQFVASRMLRNAGEQVPRRDVSTFRYGSWLVANVHLADRPGSNGFPLCWDNVIYDSRSLGYVVSTHQQGVDYGPTVLTWYHPFADGSDNRVTRREMLALRWQDWADFVIDDLRLAHPEIGNLIRRLDVMCWGHAMIQPRPGFIWSQNRIAASRPVGRIHFAGTDLSGIALFEEAFAHGVRAADEVLATFNH